MTSAFVGATMLVALYSLWVRRDTWWSRWEIGVTVAIALETCAVALMSPWAAHHFGPLLHRAVRLWNVQQLAGHLCFVVAIAANIYHMLPRMTDYRRARPMFRRQVVLPVHVGAVVLIGLFVAADAGYHPDGFATGSGNPLLDAYWVTLCLLLIYLSAYATRLLLVLRSDPRAKETIELYTASAAFALAGLVAQISTTWIDADVSTLVWLCACVSMTIFTYGSARSWKAKTAWFANNGRAMPEAKPPQAMS